MIVSLFDTVLEISVSVSVVALFILLLMPLLKKRFTAKWRYWIWLVLAVRLLIPVNYHIPQPVVQVQVPQRIAAVQTVLAPAKTIESVPVRQAEPVHTEQPVMLFGLLATVWAVGSILFLAYRFSAYFVFRNGIKRWSYLENDPETLKVFQSKKSEMGIQRNIMFCRSKKIASPMMTGFCRPILLLPETEYAAKELELILRHELIHYKRRDIWYKLFLSFANAAHWFNPIVWLMVRRAGEDTELVCDMEVVWGRETDYRKLYGETILSAVHQSRSRGTAYSTYFYGGVKAMKQRLFNILDTGKKHRGIVAFCAIVVALALVGACVACNAQTAPARGRTSSPVSSSVKTGKASDTSSSSDQINIHSVDMSGFDKLTIGAVEPEIDYVSKDTAIFHSWFGLFVYDLQNKTIKRSVNLQELDLDHVEDSITQVFVSTDGNIITLNNIYGENKDFIYVYRVDSDTMTKLTYQKITDQSVTGDFTVRNAADINGTKGRYFGRTDTGIYAYFSNGTVQDTYARELQLVFFNKKENSKRAYNVFEFASERQASSKKNLLQSTSSSPKVSSKKEQGHSEWVAYSNSKDEYKLHIKRNDGTEDKVIVNDIVLEPCVAGEWVYYLPNLEEIDKVKLDGSQKTRVCSTDALVVYNANVNEYHGLNGSTSVTAEYKDGYILYTCFQLKQTDDKKSNPPSYYKLDLNQNKIMPK